MGFLDGLLSKLGRAESADADAAGAAGPLRLALGDSVAHYRDRVVVAGVRRLDVERGTTWHYCLRDEKSAAAVLVVEESDASALWLQRPLTTEVRWEAEAQCDVESPSPLKLVRRDRARVRSWGDAGAARGVERREYSDADHDRVIVLEEYGGKREARVGGSVFESELTFERADESASDGMSPRAAALAGAFEETREDDIVKGSPRAAAKALEQNVAAKGRTPDSKDAKSAKAAPVADRDPTAYDDDSWSDAKDEAKAAAPRRKPAGRVAAGVAESATDEWGDAAEILRAGSDAGGKRG